MSEPTEAAMRAAKITADAPLSRGPNGWTRYVKRLAETIDRETGLPAKIEALRAAEQALVQADACGAPECSWLKCQALVKVRAALA